MNSLNQNRWVAMCVALICISPAAAVEELVAPLNATPDIGLPELAPGESILEDQATPISPYDVVPYEADPAVGYAAPSVVYSQPHDATHYAPHDAPGHTAYVPASPTATAPAMNLHVAPHSPHAHSLYGHSPYVPGVACCEPPKIRYWNHPLLATDVCPCDCNQTVETHVQVPCQCCPVTVKVCVPVCCAGAPALDIQRDLLGRKTYDFCWPCGYRIKIVDRHTGTLVVHTFNR